MQQSGKKNGKWGLTGLALGVVLIGLAPSRLPAQTGAVSRLLYVTNAAKGTIDVLDIDNNHKFVRSIPMSGRAVKGITAHAETARLWITDEVTHEVTAYDLKTDKVIWRINFSAAPYNCTFPDRLSNTIDGRFLYVPSKADHRMIIVEAATGKLVTTFPRPGNPHNTFKGERGQFMYCAGRSHPTLYIADPATHKVVKQIGPFSSPIRPFSVDAQEKFFYANLTNTLGFGVGDIAAGKVAYEIKHKTPAERLKYPQASGGRPHGDAPFSHGIAVHPNQKEVWFLDDEWGYLVVYDISVQPAKYVADVPLFDKIDQVGFDDDHTRWVAFDIQGRFCYPSDGKVVDAMRKVKIQDRIPASEKLIEIDFRNGVPILVGGQNGGVYGPPTDPSAIISLPRMSWPMEGSRAHLLLSNGTEIRIDGRTGLRAGKPENPAWLPVSEGSMGK